MKLKRCGLILLSVVLVMSFLFSGIAYAQEEALPDPGVTPDSPFYFLDVLGKNIGMAFAFGPEAKAKKALDYAEERLAEVQAMAAENKIGEMQRAARGYGGFLVNVNEKAAVVGQPAIAENISERVALATARHLSVLDRVRDSVPEQDRSAIVRAREASMNGQRSALRVLARQRPERAVEINLATIENSLERARAKASDNVTEAVEEALNDAAESLKLGEEISAIARGLGKDTTTVEQLVARATAHHLEVLVSVSEKVPESARPAIEQVITRATEGRKQAVTALKEKGALGEIPEEAPLVKAREAVRRVEAEANTIRARVREEGITLCPTTSDTFNRLLSEAENAFARGNYGEAENLAGQALECLTEDFEEALEELEETAEKRAKGIAEEQKSPPEERGGRSP